MLKVTKDSAALARLVQGHRRQAVVVAVALVAVVAALLTLSVSERPAAAQSEPATVGKVTGLTASADGQPDGTVQLTWNAAENAQAYFIVYLKTSEATAGSYGNVQMQPFNGTSGVIDGLGGGAEYIFLATGMRWNFVNNPGAKWSTGFSNSSRATPSGAASPSTPAPIQSEPATVGKVTGLTASADGQPDGTVSLTWNAAENAQAYFIVYLKTSEATAGSYGNVQMQPFNGTSGVIDGLGGGAEYIFLATGMRWNFVNNPGAKWSTGFSNSSRATPTATHPAEIRLDFPWLDDGLTEDEQRAIRYLREILRENPAIAKTLLGFPWLADGVTNDESWAITHLRLILRADLAVAVTLLSFPWFADGVTKSERNAAYYLREILRADPAKAKTLLASPWLADGVTKNEEQTLWSLRGLYAIDRGSLSTLNAKPWFNDGLSDEEITLLGYLGAISNRNADAAAALVGMPFLESVEIRDTLALRSLSNIAARDANDFSELMSLPKIKDGITDEETKIVAVLGGATYAYAPGSARVLLAETGVYIEERLIQLPHTGETLLAVIRVEDKITPSMDNFEHAVRTIEEFMGEPYPINYLALLFYDREDQNANNNFTHLHMMPNSDVADDHPKSRPGVIAHEAAHWYWRNDGEGYQYQKWISEGSADFLRVISEHKRIGRPLDPVKSPCPFFDNISELEKANPDRTFIPGQSTPRECYYSLGNRFFLDLYLALGDETFRPAYRTLYLRYRQDAPGDGCGGPPLNICRVAAAFKDGASPEVVAKVDEVINRWYYGTGPAAPVSLANLEHGAWLEDNRPASADRIKALPWVANGVADTEREAAEQLIRAARWYPDTFNILMAMSWVQDTITTAETRAIYGIRGTTRLNPELAKKILQKPWVQDDITRDEGIIIRRLYWLARRTDEASQQNMVDFAIRLVDMPFLDDVAFAEARAVMSLYYLAGSRYRDSFQAIMSHPKVQDGITDQEAKVIAVLRTPAHYKPEMIPHLLDGLDGSNGVYLEERTIQLPLTGETLLTIVRTQNRTTASMGYLEHAVRFAEEFMAAPLPTNYVALYFGAVGTGLAANNWYTHMAMASDRDGPERKANVFAHEVGHYYFRSPGPRWIHEGAAEIIAFVSEYERAGYPLETHLNTPCDHIKTLPASDPDEHKLCAYYLGGAFFIDLYRTLGEDAFLQGFRALHRMRWVDNPDDDCFECTQLNVHYVLEAFTSNVPEDVAAKAKEVLLKWYGPLP